MGVDIGARLAGGNERGGRVADWEDDIACVFLLPPSVLPHVFPLLGLSTTPRTSRLGGGGGGLLLRRHAQVLVAVGTPHGRA